jgi:hypothetical protein
MQEKNVHIWVWVHGHSVWKAVYDLGKRTLAIYNEYDELLIRRTGLTEQQIKVIEQSLLCIGAKRIDDHKEPYTYL